MVHVKFLFELTISPKACRTAHMAWFRAFLDVSDLSHYLFKNKEGGITPDTTTI